MTVSRVHEARFRRTRSAQRRERRSVGWRSERRRRGDAAACRRRASLPPPPPPRARRYCCVSFGKFHVHSEMTVCTGDFAVVVSLRHTRPLRFVAQRFWCRRACVAVAARRRTRTHCTPTPAVRSKARRHPSARLPPPHPPTHTHAHRCAAGAHGQAAGVWEASLRSIGEFATVEDFWRCVTGEHAVGRRRRRRRRRHHLVADECAHSSALGTWRSGLSYTYGICVCACFFH